MGKLNSRHAAATLEEVLTDACETISAFLDKNYINMSDADLAKAVVKIARHVTEDLKPFAQQEEPARE